MAMNFWETEQGYEVGQAIKDLADATHKSKKTKYDAPMQVKTFIFKYDMNIDNGVILGADATISDFIKDKLVIDLKINRLDEAHIAYVITYKDISHLK